MGKSPKMVEVYRTIGTVAMGDSTILITGESGTGKELVARAIHEASHRKEKPFVSINCSAFPETLLESELFGYMKGAFTGAAANKKGLFEAADGGSIFLDEIGDMTPAMQVKLLRVLQERRLRPLGGTSRGSGGCAGHCGHKPGSAVLNPAGIIPGRSLLQNRRHQHPPSGLARTG